MKCPVCLVTMECRSDVKDKTYMDLHCFNSECLSREINYRPHVGVVLSLAPAPWRCISYHLPFKEKGYGRDADTWYILEGKEGETTLSERSIYAETEKLCFDQGEYSAGFITMKDNVVGPELDLIVSIDQFLRISTGDRMHEEAKKAYETIKKCTEIYQDWSYDYKESSYMAQFGYGEYD